MAPLLWPEVYIIDRRRGGRLTNARAVVVVTYEDLGDMHAVNEEASRGDITQQAHRVTACNNPEEAITLAERLNRFLSTINDPRGREK